MLKITVQGCLCNFLIVWPNPLAALRHGSAIAHLLGLWVRIPPGAWMSVPYECCVLSGRCECCVLSDRGRCVGLITRPEESYRMRCLLNVIVKPVQ